MRSIFLQVFAVAFAACLLPSIDAVVATPARAAASDSSPVAVIQVAARDRVCCKRGWQDWWSTQRQCRRAGGVRVANKQCREDWNDRWDTRWWGWNGGNWDNRICCKKGRRDWWATARECRNNFGYQTSNRQCRRD